LNHELSEAHIKSKEAYDAMESGNSLIAGLYRMREAADAKTVMDSAELLASVDSIVDAAKLLTLQGSAFRGHSEGKDSANRGNLKELIELLAAHNPHLASHLERGGYPPTTPTIVSNSSPMLGFLVMEELKRELGDSNYYAINTDEARDASNTEQMSICIRFVDDSSGT
jgi:hypothetical protein